MTPAAIYDIFKKKFQGLTEANFIHSYQQDRMNNHGIYLNSTIGRLYFHYDQQKDTWLLTNDVNLKNKALKGTVKVKGDLDS